MSLDFYRKILNVLFQNLMRMKYFEICILKLIKLISRKLINKIFFFAYLPSPNLGLTPPGTYNPNARGSDACRGSNSLWTWTIDKYTRAGLPECVVSTMSGPPPKTTQDRTQTKDTPPIPGQKLKFLTPPGIEPGPPRWKAGTQPTTPRRRIELKFSIFLFSKFNLYSIKAMKFWQ